MIGWSRRNRSRHGSHAPNGGGGSEDLFGKTLFVDLMMSTLIVVTTLLIASNAIERAKKVPEKKEEQKSSIETDGLYAIVATWPADVNDDVDLWVKDPAGNLIFYGRTTAELMHLEYDDRGDVGDTAMTSTGKVKVDINRERAIIRAGMAGEYVVNVQMYTKRHPAPTTVKVSLYRLRGDDTEVLVKERVLKEGDEKTAFRFTLAPDGEMTGNNELDVRLTESVAADPQQGGMSFPGGTVP